MLLVLSIIAFKQLSVKIASVSVVIYGTKYSRMDQVKFVEDSLEKILIIYNLYMI